MMCCSLEFNLLENLFICFGWNIAQLYSFIVQPPGTTFYLNSNPNPFLCAAEAGRQWCRHSHSLWHRWHCHDTSHWPPSLNWQCSGCCSGVSAGSTRPEPWTPSPHCHSGERERQGSWYMPGNQSQPGLGGWLLHVATPHPTLHWQQGKPPGTLSYPIDSNNETWDLDSNFVLKSWSACPTGLQDIHFPNTKQQTNFQPPLRKRSKLLQLTLALGNVPAKPRDGSMAERRWQMQFYYSRAASVLPRQVLLTQIINRKLSSGDQWTFVALHHISASCHC